MKLKYIFICLLFICISTYISFSQNEEFKQIFDDAEYYYYEDDFGEARFIYAQLFEKDKTNAHVNYRIGVCYMHSVDEKTKSIPFLETASTLISPNFEEGNYKEKKAPIEALLYLADAYFISNDIEMAAKTYNDFNRKLTVDYDEYVEYKEIVKRKIETCENAIILQKLSINLTKTPLSSRINNKLSEYNPSLTKDGNTLFYTSHQKFYDGVFYAKMENGEWSYPTNFNFEAAIDGNVTLSSVSADGKQVFVVREDEGISNLYTSTFFDGKWTKIKKVSGITERVNEAHACLTSDGKTMYFSANRKNGKGGFDIYRSELGPDGKWKTPKNLGEKINTFFDEDTPFILEDGKTLFFSSQGHYNMGGYDIFVSKLQDDGEWSVPINLGYPLNTTDDNKAFFPVGDGTSGYHSVVEKDGMGERDIYEYKFQRNAALATAEILVTGKLSKKDDKKVFKDDVQVKFVNKKTSKEYNSSSFDKKTGEYKVAIEGGSYSITATSKGVNKSMGEIDLPIVYYNSSYNFSADIGENDGLTEDEKTTSDLVSVEKTDEKTDENTEIKATNTSTETAKPSVGDVQINNVLFGFDQAQTDAYYDNLNKLAGYMVGNPEAKIEVSGYADLQGEADYNLMLTQKRADFIKNYLVEKGVNAKNITAVGLGQKNQVSTDLGPETRKYNRRAEFKVSKQGKAKLEVLPLDIPKNCRL